MLIEFTAQFVATSSAAPSDKQPAKKGCKPEKGSKPVTKGLSVSVLAATSLPMEVVPASQKAEVQRRAGQDTDSSASSRLIEFAGHQLVIEEWPANTAACTGAIVWDNALLLCRYLREVLGCAPYPRLHV